MADVISVVGGIAGLITIGIQTAQTLFGVADGIGSAGREVRDLAQQVFTLTEVLNGLRVKIEQQKSTGDLMVAAIRGAIKPCTQFLKAFSKMLEPLEPLLDRYRHSRGKLEQVGLRVQWYIRTRSKVKASREMLDRHLNCLNLALATMSIQDTSVSSQRALLLSSLSHKVACLEAIHSRIVPLLANQHTSQHRNGGSLTGSDDTTGATTPSIVEEIANDNSAAIQGTPESQANGQLGTTAMILMPTSVNSEDAHNQERVEKINRKVDACLEAGLEELTDVVLMEIILQTYVVEANVLQAARDTGTQTSSDIRSPTEYSSPKPERQSTISRRKNSKQSDETSTDLKSIRKGPDWNVLTSRSAQPDIVKFRVPYLSINTLKGFLRTLIHLEHYSAQHYDKNIQSNLGYFSDCIDRPDARRAFQKFQMKYGFHVKDLEGVRILPEYWEEAVKPGMELVLK